MTLYIAPIVEGHLEQKSLERLLHRVWNDLIDSPDRLQVLTPFRGKRDQLLHPDGKALAPMVQQIFIKLQEKFNKDKDSSSRQVILILLDAEKDCPANLAPQILQSARKAQGNANIVCVLAKRMIENWIVAGSGNLAGFNGLPEQLPAVANYEDLNGSTWLNDRIRSQNPNRKYSKTVDAKAFFDKMDLQQCRANAPSFAKLCRELGQHSGQT